MPNPNILATLPEAARTSEVYAQLVESDSGLPVFSFLYNPETLAYSQTTVYAPTPTAGSNVSAQEYLHSTAPTLRLENVLVDTYAEGRSSEPIVEALQTLSRSRENNTLAPLEVTFVWGTRTYGPAVITALSWEESLWLNGEPGLLRFSLTLERVPFPERPPQGSATPAPPVTALTERQQAEGRSRGAQWLQDNLVSLNPQAQSIVSSRNQQVVTADAITGLLTLQTALGRTLGRIGTWDGRTFTPSGDLT